MADADALPVWVPPSYVGRGHPTHELAELAILSRPDHQVPMIGHQTIGQQSHRHMRERVWQQTLERTVIRLVVKDLRASVSTVREVKEHTTRKVPCHRSLSGRA